jgi:hypothetical protein
MPSPGPPANRMGRETRYLPLQMTCTLRQTEIESLLIWWCGCYQSEQAISDAQPSNLPNPILTNPPFCDMLYMQAFAFFKSSD